MKVSKEMSFFLYLLTVLQFSRVLSDDVIIVGAGISGCSAARTLLQNGQHNVTLLEANPERYGGRMWTNYDFLSDGSGLDMGAAWIHGSNLENPVYRMALRLGLPLYAINYFDSSIWNLTGTKYSRSDLNDGANKTVQIVKVVKEAATDYEEDISVYDAILREGLFDIFINPMQLLVSTFALEGFWGAPLQNISSKFFNVVNEYYGPELIVSSGYQDILTAIVEGDIDEPSLDIHLGQQVTSIEIDDVTEQAVVSTASGEIYRADSVIVTVPLGVLKEDIITFSPPLPEQKTQAIQNLGMGNYNKFAIEFSSVFWDEDISMFGVTPDGEVLSGMMVYWINLYPITGLPALVSHMVGEEAWTSENLSEEQLLDIALWRLSSMYGADVVNNQTVVNYTRTRWFSDPLSRGSWTYETLGNSHREWIQLRTPVCPALHFAGEHTAVDSYGTVDGAFNSGERAAFEIINNICT